MPSRSRLPPVHRRDKRWGFSWPNSSAIERRSFGCCAALARIERALSAERGNTELNLQLVPFALGGNAKIINAHGNARRFNRVNQRRNRYAWPGARDEKAQVGKAAFINSANAMKGRAGYAGLLLPIVKQMQK